MLWKKKGILIQNGAWNLDELSLRQRGTFTPVDHLSNNFCLTCLHHTMFSLPCGCWMWFTLSCWKKRLLKLGVHQLSCFYMFTLNSDFNNDSVKPQGHLNCNFYHLLNLRNMYLMLQYVQYLMFSFTKSTRLTIPLDPCKFTAIF